jgi:hypothetical protein
MAVFTDLDNRVPSTPFDAAEYARRSPNCRGVAERIALVHVTGRERPFEMTVENSPHEIPTSDDVGYYTDFTRRAEALLGLPPSAYFYAGRAHPDFGNVALAFVPGCEAAHTGSATPFDTGGLVHPNRYIKVRLDTDNEAELVAYGRSSEIPLDQWREVFGRVLAAYFSSEIDYWTGTPLPHDPEGLYELNGEWRSWTFEVRFYEGQSIYDRAAWCADKQVVRDLLRRQDAQGKTPPGDPTPMDRFLQTPALEPGGSDDVCQRLEQWVRDQCLT